MSEAITQFYKDLKGKKVAFIGAGVSHRECIELFAKAGAQVTLCDKKPNLDAFGAFGPVLEQLGVRLSLGEGYLEGLKGQDMIMRTPGFEFYTPELQQAAQNGACAVSYTHLSL